MVISRTLLTARLVLEVLREEHAPVLYECLRHNEIYEFIPEAPPADVATLQSRYRFLSSGRSPSEDESWLNWAIRIRMSDYIGYVQATVRNDNTASIAYVIAPRFWRSGYAREACQRVISFLLEDVGTAEIVAHVDSENIRSMSLLSALGFRVKDHLPNADVIRGRVSDEIIYNITN